MAENYSWMVGKYFGYCYAPERKDVFFECVIEIHLDEKGSPRWKWSFIDSETEIKYKFTGGIEIIDRAIYCHSEGVEHDEKALTIFPRPFSKRIKKLWGVASCTNRDGLPTSLRVLMVDHQLSDDEVSTEFAARGYSCKTSVLVADDSVADQQVSIPPILNYLVEQKILHIYNYHDYEIEHYTAKYFKDAISGKVMCEWGFQTHFQYEGEVSLIGNNINVLSKRTNGEEWVLSICPKPNTDYIDTVWGVAAGTSPWGNFPTAYRALWSREELTPDQVKQEFAKAGANLANSLITVDWNPEGKKQTVTDDSTLEHWIGDWVIYGNDIQIEGKLEYSNIYTPCATF